MTPHCHIHVGDLERRTDRPPDDRDPANSPYDPVPGVREVEQLSRMANRPPDGVVDFVTAKMLDLENRAKAEVQCRDAREAVLKAEIDYCESVKGILIQELQAEEDTTRRLTVVSVVLFCALCWLEGWRVAAWAWPHYCRLVAWLWRLL